MPLANQWDPDHPLVHKERVVEDPRKRAITLRHPQYPCVTVVPSDNLVDFQTAAAVYLRRIAPTMGFVDAGGNVLIPASGRSDFAKLPNGFCMTWLLAGGDPNDSFWVNRRLTGPTKDRSVVLFAVQSITCNDATSALRSGLGVRISATVLDAPNSQFFLRITGAACPAELAPAMLETNFAFAALARFSGARRARLLATTFGEPIASYVGEQPSDVYVSGVRVEAGGTNPPVFEVFVHAKRPAVDGLESAYALMARVQIDPAFTPIVLSVTKTPLVAHAEDGDEAAVAPVVEAHLFTREPKSNLEPKALGDPTSQLDTGQIVAARPNREKLERYRRPIAMPGLKPGKVPLKDRNVAWWFEVRQSDLVDPAGDITKIHRCDPTAIRHARTRNGDFAAASAYRQTAELFEKIDRFGLSRDEFFKFATKPLLVRYRSTMLRGSGRDGRVVNAQVDFDPPRNRLGERLRANSLKPLQVRFGLADIKRSVSRREPLGLSTDPRWSWHEFCHVLLAAATGRLELPFVHSAGDALAAIVNDPRSNLVNDPRRPEMRGATYPWVHINRRHDREVRHGWSWSGTFHRPLRFDLSNCDCRHKGYDSEQILSTSLFRLYRALGGDTVEANGTPDFRARLRASEFTVYLIMRAILSLGSANSVPTQTPDQFVSALILADESTQRATIGPLLGRAGGCAHKVIRWAFEAQGLYADVPAAAVHDAPGAAPPFDIFIDDRRGEVAPSHVPGTYTPVSLDWNTRQPAWHASAAGMQVAGDQLWVRVDNRGSRPATNVTVHVSWKAWPQGVPAPKWNHGAWVPHQPLPIVQTIAVNADGVFGPFTLPTLTGRYLILAEANSDGDRPNTYDGLPPSDPDYAHDDLPCAARATPLVDLVAGDNNLGLIVYEAP